jgi:RNA polymerase sigma-70 factor (family 1)
MQQILERIQQQGDQVAFREFYLFYSPQLLTFAYTYTKSKFVAEEVINDVFLGLWKNRERIHEISNMKVYLYKGVKNGIINYFTRNKEWQHLDIDEIADVELKFSADPEEILITAELRKKIEAAIASLPPKCQVIFKLIKEDGIKHREVAEILDISIKTVENQMTIAIRKINSVIQIPMGKGTAVTNAE